MKLALVACFLLCSSILAANQVSVASKISITRKPVQKLYRFLGPLPPTPYDIVHVIDGSASVGGAGHEYAKSAAKLTNMFYDDIADFGTGGSRAALVKFSTVANTEIVFPLTEYSTLMATDAGIDGLVFDWGSRTAIGKGLQKAREELVLHSGSNKEKIWLFTDGKNNDNSTDPDEEAQKLKDRGAQVCVVGIGKSIDQPALEALASEKDGELCIFVFIEIEDYYDALLGVASMIRKARRDKIRKMSKRLSKLKTQTRKRVRAANRAARKANKRVV